MKKYIVKKIINVIFPEFSNKITWALVITGLSIIALPIPYYLMALNFIIDIYNKKFNADIDIIKIDNGNPSTMVAITLIALGLTYNLLSKVPEWFFDSIKIKENREKKERQRNSDINLYKEFIKLLPPDSNSIDFLKGHDFGNRFHDSNLKDMTTYCHEWGKAIHHFHDNEIEIKSNELHKELTNFNYFLACNSGYLGSSEFISMLSDREIALLSLPPEKIETIKKANGCATKIYNMYCEFILLCKKNLSI